MTSGETTLRDRLTLVVLPLVQVTYFVVDRSKPATTLAVLSISGGSVYPRHLRQLDNRLPRF